MKGETESAKEDRLFREVLLPKLRESASVFTTRWDAAPPGDRLSVLYAHAGHGLVFALIGDDAQIIQGADLLQMGVDADRTLTLTVAAVPCANADHAEAVRQMLVEAPKLHDC